MADGIRAGHADRGRVGAGAPTRLAVIRPEAAAPTPGPTSVVEVGGRLVLWAEIRDRVTRKRQRRCFFKDIEAGRLAGSIHRIVSLEFRCRHLFIETGG